MEHKKPQAKYSMQMEYNLQLNLTYSCVFFKSELY